MNLTHFSLFTGIGGIDLAAEWAGFETVGQCEWADYPTKVLEKHWPNVPKWRDIRSVTAESFYERTGLRTVDLISGGFPCQPFSTAGNRKGENDDRYLWPEMLRVISEFKPTWVIGENVAGIISIALDQVLSDLENINYSTQAFVIPACSRNAFHKRNRVFIVANINSELRETYDNETKVGNKQIKAVPEEWGKFFIESSGNNTFAFRKEDEPKLCGDDDGVRNRLDEDRLKCLGNTVNPYQVYPILQAIADIEKSCHE
jgi:DNA (cytosine-5)-methyltransferase 1